jgi:DNA topoisomerase-1
VAGERFTASGHEIVEPHWRAVYPYIRITESVVPALTQATVVDVTGKKQVRKKTKPPRRYSQGTLISEMEKKNLGTKSTRHEIIKKLYSRKYVTDKQLTPTLSAVAVTEALKRNAEAITKADMTADLEEDMNMIAAGKKTSDEVVHHSREMLQDVMKTMEEKRDEIGSSIQRALAQQSIAGTCPKCGGDMVIRKSRKRFLGCSNYPRCTNSYPLPQKGKLVFKGMACKECGAPVITVVTRKKWDICANMDCPSKKNAT